MTLTQLIAQLQALELLGHGEAPVFIGDEDEMTTKTAKPEVKYEEYPLNPHFTGVYIESDYKVR